LLVNNGGLPQKIIVIVCYLVPTFAIILYGRDGNISLLAVTVVLAGILFLRAESQVDVQALAS
jgi:hypothetical protein